MAQVLMITSSGIINSVFQAPLDTSHNPSAASQSLSTNIPEASAVAATTITVRDAMTQKDRKRKPHRQRKFSLHHSRSPKDSEKETHWLRRAVSLLRHKATKKKSSWGSGGLLEAFGSRTWL
eukprot:1154234-Pelagomonas_calceolata.AAC.1